MVRNCLVWESGSLDEGHTKLQMTCFGVRRVLRERPYLPWKPPKDILSEVLKALKLGGATFYSVELSAPWCFRSAAARILAPYFWGTRSM